ncbi:cytochrome ubiquinol oxidase subunit I [Fulvimarina endophytica]|uniref:Cytochrome ubiquinol oxidase subunit I n=1 Tax=Fulvimarina endophytica TaxID=2293836 RepID=A0A371XAS7_9HYPH|nr:cbb3-type cytochrome c oxidase subunit I [Fulvimarina endophytica]RFC66345.1 cytochrome ubiquinol oxidase subunit I [Fulvimarina endophytica]
MNESFLFGRLSLSDFEPLKIFHNPDLSTAIGSIASWIVIVGVVAVLGLLTVKRWWGPLFTQWLNTTDHKKIGIMYLAFAGIMFTRGVLEGVVMRAHLMTSYEKGFLSSEHFAELFSTHGTIMIFFVLMPALIGLMNLLVPLQIGARDVAFPKLNQISLGFTVVGGMLIMISLVIGGFETGGWTAYPPFTGATFQPGPGPDYWVWAIGLSGVGSLLSGLNFAVTIYKMRCPGMTFMRMPLFTWTALCTSILLIFALPPLTAVTLMQALDRYLDFHFFTNDLGGNMMNYANMFWMFGHPEVYILILPAFGIYSEISQTFSGKVLYGYVSLVAATMAIAVLSFTVWLHHFFTMGQSSAINAAFGIATMLIAIPTGVKVYVWIATLWRGRVRLRTPIVYLAGFIVFFVIGGYTGVMLANPTINFAVHNSQFVVAHFHNVLLPGSLFAILAAIYTWFPKFFGFRLDETWSLRTAYLFVAGFAVTFLPLYALGLMGYPRRSPAFDDPAFIPYVVVSFVGALILVSALTSFFVTFLVSVRHRDELAVPGGDPWDGWTLEWASPAPVPEWNFAVIPQVSSRHAFGIEKMSGQAFQFDIDRIEPVDLPAKSYIGLAIAVFGTMMGFALVFWIWWLAALSLLVMVGYGIALGFLPDRPIRISAEEIARVERRWIEAARSENLTRREDEVSPTNHGYAAPIAGARA